MSDDDYISILDITPDSINITANDVNRAVYQVQFVKNNICKIALVGYFKTCEDVLINKFSLCDEKVEAFIVSCILNNKELYSFDKRYPLIKLILKNKYNNSQYCILYFSFCCDKKMKINTETEGHYEIFYVYNNELILLNTINNIKTKEEIIEKLIESIFSKEIIDLINLT